MHVASASSYAGRITTAVREIPAAPVCAGRALSSRGATILLRKPARVTRRAISWEPDRGAGSRNLLLFFRARSLLHGGFLGSGTIGCISCSCRLSHAAPRPRVLPPHRRNGQPAPRCSARGSVATGSHEGPEAPGGRARHCARATVAQGHRLDRGGPIVHRPRARASRPLCRPERSSNKREICTSCGEAAGSSGPRGATRRRAPRRRPSWRS